MKIGKFAVGFVEDDGRARNVGKQQYRKIRQDQFFNSHTKNSKIEEVKIRNNRIEQ
jgi:hypothetical protein